MKRVQVIGQIEAESNSFVGRAREFTIDTTNNEFRIHDGATPGGHRVPNLAFNDARYLAVDTTQISVDTILEHTVGNGVSIDGVLLKDGNITLPGLVDGVNVSVLAAATGDHIADVANPHAVTKTQVGLANVTNDAQLKITSNLSDLNNVDTALTNLGFSTFVKTILNDADAAAVRATIGANVTLANFSAYFQTLFDDADAAAARGTLGLGTIATQNANAVAIKGQIGVAYYEKNDNYNVQVSDDGATLAMTANNKVFTLPTIASSIGCKFTFRIKSTTGIICTIDGNGSETIEGMASVDINQRYYDSINTLNGGGDSDTLTLQNDGTEWKIVGGHISRRKESLGWTASEVSSSPHGMHRLPNFITPALVCRTAQYGYAQGDMAAVVGNGTTTLISGFATPTHIGIANGTSAPSVIRRDTGAVAAITAANWMVIALGTWIF